MKRIPLVNGGFVLVSNQDYPYLSQFKWRKVVHKKKNKSYAAKGTPLLSPASRIRASANSLGIFERPKRQLEPGIRVPES